MWPFKKKGKIIINCNFPRFCFEDQRFILAGLKNDIRKEYGICYDVDIKLNENKNEKDCVIVEVYKNTGTVERRAIQIKILSHIKKSK